MNHIAGAVLCAGLGTRLRPLTHLLPKPAVPFLSRPIAWYGLEALRQAGVTDVGVNVHHLPTQMQQSIEMLCPNDVALTFHREREILGTGGGTRELWRRLGPDRPLVVYHGDVLCGQPLAPVLAAHEASGAEITLVLRVRRPDDVLRNVFTDETGRVVGLFEHRHPNVQGMLSEHSFTGIHILNPSVFDHLPPSGFSCLVTEIYPRLLAQGRAINAFLTTAFLADLGTYERYLDGQRAVLDAPGRLPTWTALPGTSHMYLGPHVRVDEGAVLVPPVHLDGMVHVSEGAEVGPNVSMVGRWHVDAGVQVSNAALWGRGTVSEPVEQTLELRGEGLSATPSTRSYDEEDHS